MKTRIMVVIVLIVILFVSGCGGDTPNTLQKNYKLGYGSLALVVDEQRSPSVVYQHRPFSLALTLYNRAGYEAKNVQVSMGSYDQTFISVPNPQQQFSSLEARSAFTDDNGGRADLSFNGETLDLHGSEERRENYRLYVSYDSKMEFAPTICVNTASYSVFDAGCQMPAKPLSFSGQGAPLAITKMEEIVVGAENPELELRLHVEDKGQGKIKSMRLGQARLGNVPLACSFRDMVVNEDKSFSFKKDKRDGEVICTATLSEKYSYDTSLFVELLYNYEFSVARQVTIKK